MHYSVVIPARNAALTIGTCVLALLSQSVPREEYEIILVDDGSTDHTAYLARKFGIRVLLQPPLGVATARNTGARAATGEIVVFLDADCLPTFEWLARMVQPFDDASVGAVQGVYANDQSALLSRLIQADRDEQYESYRDHWSIDAFHGFSLACRRELFLRLRGFDITYGPAADVEFAYRLETDRVKVIFAPDARVFNTRRQTVSGYIEHAIRRGLWRSLIRARHANARSDVDRPVTRMRVQVGLAGLLVVAALAGLRQPRAERAAGYLAVAFAGTTLPAVWQRRESGALVAAATPPFQLLRAVSLGFGQVLGYSTVVTSHAIQMWSQLSRSFRR